MSIEAFMPEARQIAAQCWCDEETSHIEMDVVLAEAVARRIAVWMNTAREYNCNSEFWRTQLYACHAALGDYGKDAYVQDDGGIVDTPLALKIPTLVQGVADMLRQLN